MRNIGGFFELELNSFEEYHKALQLNSGRNCLEYILRVNKYKKVYLPYYVCDVVFEPFEKCGVEYEFYNIDEEFKPIFDLNKVQENEAFMYVNYFGLNQNTVKYLSDKITNLIVDNTQAFYAQALIGVDTFYSPRKFFGVPDGAYLYISSEEDFKIKKDNSFERMSHLLKRIDLGPQESYNEFKSNSKLIVGQDIKAMSQLTISLLKNIDYKKIQVIRNENFNFLHSKLKQLNELDIDVSSLNAPMIYPFKFTSENLKQKLINNNVFVATYWPNVLQYSDNAKIEVDLVNNIIALPIDQRYNIDDMNYIIDVINANI